MSNLKSVGLTVLELLAFNSHDRPLRTDTETHTSNEHIISAIHFVHLAEIMKISNEAKYSSEYNLYSILTVDVSAGAAVGFFGMMWLASTMTSSGTWAARWRSG